MRANFDVLVLGASLAGASLALRLAQAGISVGLIDKSNFPRRKPCGEGLSALGHELLIELGLAKDIQNIPHCELLGISIWSGSNRYQIEFALCEQGSGTIGVQREELDNIVVRAALNAHLVAPFFGRVARTLTRGNHGFELVTDCDVLTSTFVVLADGGASFGAQQLKIPVLAGEKNRYGYTVSLRAEFRQPLQHIHIFLAERWEIFCTPVGSDVLNISMLSSKTELGRALRSGEFRNECHRAAHSLDFEIISMAAGLGSGPVGNSRRAPYVGNALLIGDACEVFDPIGGMGMTHALKSAQLASKALIQMLLGDVDTGLALREYASEREKIGREMRGLTRLTQLSLTYPKGAPAIRFFSRTGLPAMMTNLVHAPAQQTCRSGSFQRVMAQTIANIAGSY